MRLAGRDMPSSRRLDEDGRLRVVAVPDSLEGMAFVAFNAVFHYAGSDADVLENSCGGP